MTPEIAEYHRAMLMVGLQDRFYQDFDTALENENPLSDLMLSLCTCVSDMRQVISILHEYTLDHKINEQKVYDLILDDIRSRYLNGALSRTQVVSTLYGIVQCLDKFWDEPWHQFSYLTYDLELCEDGLIAEEVFIKCFDAWLFRGEHLSAWDLQRELNNRTNKPKK